MTLQYFDINIFRTYAFRRVRCVTHPIVTICANDSTIATNFFYRHCNRNQPASLLPCAAGASPRIGSMGLLAGEGLSARYTVTSHESRLLASPRVVILYFDLPVSVRSLVHLLRPSQADRARRGTARLEAVGQSGRRGPVPDQH